MFDMSEKENYILVIKLLGNKYILLTFEVNRKWIYQLFSRTFVRENPPTWEITVCGSERVTICESILGWWVAKNNIDKVNSLEIKVKGANCRESWHWGHITHEEKFRAILVNKTTFFSLPAAACGLGWRFPGLPIYSGERERERGGERRGDEIIVESRRAGTIL